MAETLIPPWLQPETPVEITRTDDMTSIFSPRFARGRGQRQIWADPRWSVNVRYSAMRSHEVAAMRRALAEARGRGVTLRWTPGRTRRGSFPAPEMISVGNFENGTTGWSATSTGVITASDRTLRSSRVDTNNFTAYATAAATVVAGDAYVARVFNYVGKKATAASVGRAVMGTSAGGGENGTAAVRTDSGFTTVAALMGTTSCYLGAYDDNGSKASGDYHDIAWASLSRCARVDGASQTGSALTIKNCPPSTNGLLLAGDFFEVNGDLKECTASVDSNGSGLAYVRFRPGLARSPADNDPVIINNPMGRFMLASDPAETEQLGAYLSVDLQLVESYEE